MSSVSLNVQLDELHFQRPPKRAHFDFASVSDCVVLQCDFNPQKREKRKGIVFAEGIVCESER